MVQILQTKKSDIRKLAAVYVDAYNSIHIGEEWNIESAEKMLSFFFTKQPDLFFTAWSDDNIVGAIVAIVKPWWNGNHLTDGELFVSPQCQKQGIGKMLIRALFTESKSKYAAVSWDTFTHIIHEHPLSWYKKLGFRTIDEWAMIEGRIDTVLAKLDGK
jgi:GNAT superfamily N-acetyltransferase